MSNPSPEVIAEVERAKSAWLSELAKYIGFRGRVAPTTCAGPDTRHPENSPNHYIERASDGQIMIGPVGEGDAWDWVYSRCAEAAIAAALQARDDQISALIARVAELEGVLKPFAAAADDYSERLSDPAMPEFSVTMGDLHKARAAPAKKDETI